MAVMSGHDSRVIRHGSLLSQSLNYLDTFLQTEMSLVIACLETVRAFDDQTIQFEIAQREPSFFRPYACISRVKKMFAVMLDNKVLRVLARSSVQCSHRGNRVI